MLPVPVALQRGTGRGWVVDSQKEAEEEERKRGAAFEVAYVLYNVHRTILRKVTRKPALFSTPYWSCTGIALAFAACYWQNG
jgi:hypothetical protein